MRRPPGLLSGCRLVLLFYTLRAVEHLIGYRAGHNGYTLAVMVAMDSKCWENLCLCRGMIVACTGSKGFNVLLSVCVGLGDVEGVNVQHFLGDVRIAQH